MKRFFFILLCTLLFFGCGKDKKEFAPGEVCVRLENATGFVLEDAMVGEMNYGNVSSGQLTEYKQMTTLIYAGYCLFMRNGVQSVAGYGLCGTPMPPPFDPGYYTFKVEAASAGVNTIVVIKR